MSYTKGQKVTFLLKICNVVYLSGVYYNDKGKMKWS